jgi:hypothetical protein
MDNERVSVIARLEAYNQRFEAILEMLRGQLPLRGVAKVEAQAKLKSLKQDLGEEFRLMSSVRGEASLTEIEKAFYAPAISQTFTEISIPTNSIPDGKWFSELYGAQMNILHTLNELRARPTT